jgi:hypothetical protein
MYDSNMKMDRVLGDQNFPSQRKAYWKENEEMTKREKTSMAQRSIKTIKWLMIITREKGRNIKRMIGKAGIIMEEHYLVRF